jgi:hypothetical protein
MIVTMEYDKMAARENALIVFADSLRPKPDGASVQWLVVGSVASVLQGCRFEPRDLDILVTSREDLDHCVAHLLTAPGVVSLEDPPIYSEKFGDFEWHKAQFEIDGFLTELVYIASGGGIPDSIEGDGIWEGGKIVWSYAKTVPFHGLSVPITPLEIQLESQLRRGVTEKADEILCVEPEGL